MNIFKQSCDTYLLRLTIPFLTLLLFSSCLPPEHDQSNNAYDIVPDEEEKYCMIRVKQEPSLNYDFNNYGTYEFENDRIEIISSHPRMTGLNMYSEMTGKIDNFAAIYYLNDTGMIENSRLGSITLTANLVNNTITHTAQKEDVFPKWIMGIPYKALQASSGSITIKSIKSKNHGLQIVWKQSDSYPNWKYDTFEPDDNIISDSDYESYIKSGGSKSPGEKDKKDIYYIEVMDTDELIYLKMESDDETYPNKTEDKELEQVDDFVFSKTLERDIIVGEEISEDSEWAKPNIYKEVVDVN